MNYKFKSIACILALLCLSSSIWQATEAYQIGLGRADITGPPVEINFVSIRYLLEFQIGQKNI